MNTGRQYRVVATLGKGAFGDVFLAETVGTGIARTVAVKVLHKDRAEVPGLLARLRDEARMLAMLKHRAIVAVDDLVELDGAWSIVMEYVEGADVAEILEAAPIPPVPALQIAEEICYALHAAWTTPAPDGTPLRLVHRDVKPSNVRVTPHGDVKLLDFGVARADFGEREGATVDAALGTIAYMAPERFAGEDLPAGDIYALGVTLFEMLTGMKPGKTAGDVDRAPPGRACAAQWTWLKQASPALQELITRMLSRSPEDRPTARDAARKLALIRAGIEGETLSEWAEKVVPPLVTGGIAARRDERSGSVLIERTGSLNLPPAEGGRMKFVVAGGAFGAFGLAAVVVLGVVLGVGAWYLVEGRDEAAAPAPLTPVPPAQTASTPTEPTQGTPAPELAPPTEPVAPTVATADPTAQTGDAATADAAAPVARTEPTKPDASKPDAAKPEPTKPDTTKPDPTRPDPKAEAKVDPKATPKPEAPVEAPKAATEPAVTATTGTLVVAGDATSVVFRGAGGTSRGGTVQPGTWSAEVSFGDKQVTVRDIQVLAGKTTTVKCSSGFLTCRVSGP